MGKKKKSSRNRKPRVKIHIPPVPLFQNPMAPVPLFQYPMAPIPIFQKPVPRPQSPKGVNMANLTTVKDVEVYKRQRTDTEVVQECIQHSGINIPIQHTQAVEHHGQCSDANIYGKQLELQSKYQMTPEGNLQSSGSSIQQLPLQSYHTPFLQSSGPNLQLSPSLTSTTGGTESVAAQKEVTEVDLTEEETEGSLSDGVIELESLDDVVEVDSLSAAHLLAIRPDILADTSPDIWHKVIVKSSLVDRIGVLNSISKLIAPWKLTPYFFRKEDGHMTFLVNNCCAALTVLFKRHLIVSNAKSRNIELKVQLRAKRVNLDAILERVIRKRLGSEQPFLDLSDLASIPEIQQVMYHESKLSHLLQELVRKAHENVPGLIGLSLAGNQISVVRHFTSVFANRFKWWPLKVLDLSDNQIMNLHDVIAVFGSLPITEFYLHRNPVCGRYGWHINYSRNIRNFFPSVIKLDGIYLDSMPSVPQSRQNYFICNGDGDGDGDLAELADQFVEHFFTLYDGEDRSLLRGLYHEDAYFSLSCTHLPGLSSSHCAKLTSYVEESRNLLHSSSKLTKKATLCKGAEKILAKLTKLPRTRHDPYSFTVDLLHHSESTVLTVTGVFKEPNLNQVVSSRHFMRTFVLIRLENDEYQIVNDIMCVTNATTSEAQVAFRYIKPSKTVKKIKPSRNVTDTEKLSMTQKYSQLTNMRPEWSHKCLDTVGWNLREALEIFIEMYKADKIPESSFKTTMNRTKL